MDEKGITVQFLEGTEGFSSPPKYTGWFHSSPTTPFSKEAGHLPRAKVATRRGHG